MIKIRKLGKGEGMNQRFFDVKKEKQDRIINAGLKVFARAGYRHASTDEVVKTAGISKGLLFHYFGSKLGLYAFLYDYSSRFMLLELRQELEEKERESGEGSTGERAEKESFFRFVRHREAAFMRIYRLYPYMRRFLEMAELEDCAEAAEAVEEMRRGYRRGLWELEKGMAAEERMTSGNGMVSEEGMASEERMMPEERMASAEDGETERAEPEAWRESGRQEEQQEKERRLEARAVELAIRGLVEEESRKPGYTPEGLYRQICEYLELFERAFGG